MKLFCYSIFFPLIVGFGQSSKPVDTHYFLDPGIKIGYAFGENGGLFYGLELSYVITGPDSKHPSYGLTFSYDFLPTSHRIHVGAEFLSPFAGIDIGPSLLLNESTNLYGLSLTTFAGIFILPHYQLSLLSDGVITHEVGSFVKVPIQLDHYNYNWRNSD